MTLLAGYRVLDLTDERGLMAGRILADLGADVVAVEPPGGSPARAVPPLAERGADQRSMYWEAFSANKRSIICDLGTDEGCDQVRQLAARSDMLITSLEPGLLAECQLDWPALSELHPRLVYVQITAFGMTGPKAGYAGSDLIVWAASGALHPNRHGQRPPVKVSSPQAFLHAGADAAVAALIALRHSQQTDQGQLVDISAQVSSAGATICRVLAHAVHDDAPGWEFEQRAVDQSGSGSATPPEEKKWVCRDGYIEMNLGMGAAAGAFTNRLAAWMHAEGALDDELAAIDWRVAPELIEQRQLAPDVIGRLRGAVTAFWITRTKEEANVAALEHRLSCSALRDVSDVAASPQLTARDFWVRVGEGRRRQVLPGPFARTAPGAFDFRRPAPLPGEHSGEVLAEWLAGSRKQAAPSPAPGDQPFSGLKVFDLSWVFAGPMVSRTLADFGATVVHGESGTRLDTARRMKPYHGGQPGPERGAVFGNCNAGKLGIALDFSLPEARQVASDLARWADVVVESYSPGVMRRWGLDYETLSVGREDLIMVSSCLNGQTGPMAELAGFGNTGAALSGFAHLGGWPDQVPIGPFGPYTDYLAPRLALATLLAALDERRRSGRGRHIDVSQIESGVYFLGAEMADYFATGRIAQRAGNADPRHAPHGVYPCRREDGIDRFIAVAVTDQQQWRALAGIIGGATLAADRRYGSADARLRRADELDQLISTWCGTRDVAEVEAYLQAHGVPAHRTASSRDFVEDTQLAHRGHLVTLPHPTLGRTVVEGPRYQLTASPGRVWRAAPTIGQDNDHVLRDLLGYRDDEITALVQSGALR
jgi:crotonobetainyl-CoA:carnitine CoA-transferase CaiB-like acyl-CoA transferase